MGTSPTNNPKLNQVITTLQYVKASGQFWCLVGTNVSEVPDFEHKRLDGYKEGEDHPVIATAWMLSDRAANGQSNGQSVIAQVYGLGEDKNGGGYLVVVLNTKDKRLCFLACQLQENVSDVAGALASNPRRLQEVMAIFDARFRLGEGSEKIELLVEASQLPTLLTRHVKTEEHNRQLLPRFVYSADR